MGLDQFAYSLDKDGNKSELAYWRKHPNLQGWMENLWYSKGCPNKPEQSSSPMGDFNCIPVELTKEDINSLENDIVNNKLPSTMGFFFGNDSDDYYKKEDLEFVRKAKTALEDGLTVMYDSWW